MMQQTRFIHLLIGCLACVLTACSDPQPISNDTVKSQFDADAINIGYLHGSPIRLRNSAALAAKHINDAGGVLGKPLNIVYNQIGTSDIVQQKARVMIDDYHIPALIVTTSSRSLAVSDIAAPKGVLVISETATSPTLSTYADNDFLFRTAPSDAHQGRAMADLAKQHGASSVSILYNKDDAYGNGLADVFEQNFVEGANQTLVRIEIPDQLFVGFDNYMDAVFAHQPDAVITALVRTTVNSNFINETVNQNFQGFYIFPDVATDPTFTGNIADPKIISSAYGITPSSGLLTHPPFQFFSDSYLSMYNTAPQNFNANVYDAVMIIALALEHAGLNHQTTTPTGTMIRDSIRAVMNPDGEKISPQQIALALSNIRQGVAINYSGAYSDNDFDANGDIVGQLVYDSLLFDNQTATFTLVEQIVIEVPLE